MQMFGDREAPEADLQKPFGMFIVLPSEVRSKPRNLITSEVTVSCQSGSGASSALATTGKAERAESEGEKQRSMIADRLTDVRARGRRNE